MEVFSVTCFTAFEARVCSLYTVCNDGFLFLLKNTVSSGRKERELSRKS